MRGRGVSTGVGIGRAVILPSNAREVVRKEAGEGEAARFSGAVKCLCAALEEKAGRTGNEQAEILESHIILLGDPAIAGEVGQMVTGQNCNTEYAVSQVFDRYAALFCSMGDELMAARAVDLADIKNNLLTLLAGEELFDVGALPPGTVLVAGELTTTIAAGIDPEKVTGIVTREGGKTSHMAIIARSLGLPAVAGVSVQEIAAGATVIVNGDTGEVSVNPTDAVLEEYSNQREAQQKRRQALEEYRGLESVTLDGVKIELCANIGLESDIQSAVESDAEGVGLLRTEFLFLGRSTAPTEEEQFLVYKKAARSFAGHPVIIRTLDVGGDKEIPCLGIEQEANPFLGWRGIRYCLDRRELFSAQLRAILRASAFGNVKIMLPMISSLTELRVAKALIESAKTTLTEKGIAFRTNIPVGVMIETPSAAILADRFARESDFFSIGTNDLTQYVMAVDRGNKKVEALYSAYDPAVLRLIYKVAKAAGERGIPCGVCGEAGSDPLLTKFLVGCGVNELSMAGSCILQVRGVVRGIDCRQVQKRVGRGVFDLEDVEDSVRFLEGL